MTYYIHVTAWNLLESFVTESISPHIFYTERNFGNNLSRYLDFTNELGNFLILSTRDTQGDYSIEIDGSIIDPSQLEPIKDYDTLFTYNRTIYYKKGHVAFRFANQELMDSLIAKSHILFEVKCIEKYADRFYVKEVRTHAVDVSAKLCNRNSFSFSLTESVKRDNIFNILKGAITGYARGILTTSSTDEQILKSSLIGLKNNFAGINTDVMITGEPIKEHEKTYFYIQKCHDLYNEHRTKPTNQFDILSQQFSEAVNLAKMRYELIEAKKRPDFHLRIHNLESSKKLLEKKIFDMELAFNILELKDELNAIKEQERLNGLASGKTRVYFKKGTYEYERKILIKKEIASIEDNHIEFKQIREKIEHINQQISELKATSSPYDNTIQGIFTRISDIMNDLIKKVNDTEQLNPVDFNAIEVSETGDITVKIGVGCAAEAEYFNTVLSYLVSTHPSEPVSDALMLKIIAETARIYKKSPSSNTAEGNAILKCLRDFWSYKKQQGTVFSIPNNLPVFQSVMAFFIKPFGFDQIERYLLNNQYSQKAFAFMLWGACMGYAAIPKTFTHVLYQESTMASHIDEFLHKIYSNLQ